jgi:tRNA nucleotidyltransferase/poly(A) polymerase
LGSEGLGSLEHKGQGLLALLAPDRSDPYLAGLNPSIAIYCVGGAVRDTLIGDQEVDRDYLVVGARPEDLLQAGFKPVGKDFPVFLHPDSKNEYALARTERKTGAGYRGFEIHADPSVRLEDDLCRRDLSINAMAVDEQGRLHDPYGGLEDLQRKKLRHISSAFREDPVRLLRLARFLSRWPEFQVSTDTLALCEAMRDDGELQALVAERVWQELYKGLDEKAPGRMIGFLRTLGLLEPVLGLAQQQVDAGLETRLNRASTLGLPAEVKAALLLAEAKGGLRNKLPKKVEEWIALLPGFSALERLLEAPTAWPENLTAWASRADIFRRPERLGAMALLGQLLLADQGQETNLKLYERWGLWISLCDELSRLSVSAVAQSQSADDPSAIREAIEGYRQSFVHKRLAESTIND